MKTLFPDGRVLAMTGNPHGVTGPWSNSMTVQTRSQHFRLLTGARGWVEGFPAEMGEPVKVREASKGRNRVVAVEHLGPGGTTLVWQSDFHEVSTYVHGTGVPLEMVTSMFAPLQITDSPSGVVVRARPGTGARIEYQEAANFIPDIGTVTVKPLEAATTQIPHSGGKSVSGGQLWREDRLDDDGDLAERTLVLANESTASFLVPFDPAHPQLASLIQSINISLS